MHDLDLRWPDGSIHAMEVTSASGHSVPAMKAAQSDLLKPRYGMVNAEKVAYKWAVGLASTQDAKHVRPQLSKIHRQLAKVLAELESEETFGLFRDQVTHQSKAVDALRALGIKVALALPADPAPGIYLMPPQSEQSDWEPTPASMLNGQIEIDARANAVKLGRSGRSERHLWVWVDELHPVWPVFDSATLLDDTFDLLPQRVPNLPPEVTTAWAATEVHGTVIWRVRPPESWEELFRGSLDEED